MPARFLLLRRGFTLVELAIVLVLLGLLIGLGASLLGPLTKRAKYSESKEEVRRTVEALKGYGVKYGCLPAPSDAFSRVGVKGYDAHGKALLYVVSQGLTCDSDYTEKICNADPNETLTIQYTGHNQTISSVAFVVISGGDDFNIQSGFSDTKVIANEFDDIVEHVSLFELIEKRCIYSSSGYCTTLTVMLDTNISSYRKNNLACQSGTSLTMEQADYLETYYGGGDCKNLCGNFTFSTLIGYDADKDCSVQITKHGNTCYPQDM